jgi:hypothetical protein
VVRADEEGEEAEVDADSDDVVVGPSLGDRVVDGGDLQVPEVCRDRHQIRLLAEEIKA